MHRLAPKRASGAVAAGAMWVALPAFARVYLGVNEIISTLVLNFVAIYWVLYWATERWPEPFSPGGVKSKLIPSQGELGELAIGGLVVPAGFLLLIGGCVLVAIAARTTTGYEVEIAGATERAAVYAGMSVRRLTISVLLLGGAFGGLAGAIEMMGNTHRYSDQLSNQTGYTGVVIAVLAGPSALAVLGMTLLFSVISIGAGILRVSGASSELVFAAYGLTLAFAALGQALSQFTIVRTRMRHADARRPADGTT